MTSLFDVAIVGAGASGTTLAANLVRVWPTARIALIDGKGFARGLAYSTRHPQHLLNVPAAKMSALASEPDHFLEWLKTRISADGSTFATRMVYGDYLDALLKDTARRSRGTLTLLASDAISAMQMDAWSIRLEDGATIAARTLVLALGNDAPAPLKIPGAEELRAARALFDSPWLPGALEAASGPVLLVGTGLTAVDAAVALAEAGTPAVHALSRHGLMPASHAPVRPYGLNPFDRPNARGWLRHLRREVRRAEQEGSDWRAVVDGLRPITPSLWRAFGGKEQRRFLRHLRHHWDTHRHRMAPEIGARIEALRATGQLQIHAGRLLQLKPHGDRIAARFRQRGTARANELQVARVINCTGPASLGDSQNPLVRQLLAGHHLELDPLGLGLHVDTSGQLLSSGATVDGLFALGPLRRGECWESTAIPELRTQAAELAGILARDFRAERSRVRG